jgi:hypothetical protein
LEQERKNSAELELLLKQNLAKREFSTQEIVSKCKQLDSELEKVKQEKLNI